MDAKSVVQLALVSKGNGEALRKSSVSTITGVRSLAKTGMKNRDSEFGCQAEGITMRYAEWHKAAVCRNTTKKALIEAYLKGRQDADTAWSLR